METQLLHPFIIDIDNLFKGARFGDNAYYKLSLKRRSEEVAYDKG